jgi:uncharacterized protein (TIRG00374 family)
LEKINPQYQKGKALMPKKRKIPWFNILRLLGIGLFLYILFNIDFKSAWEIIKTSNIYFIFLGILCQLILLLIKAHRWFLLRKNAEDQPKWRIVSAQFLESYAIGVFTPGRIGEFMKAGHEEKKKDKISSVLKIFFERGFDLCFFFFFSGLFLMKFFPVGIVSILIISFGVLLGAITFLMMYSQKMTNILLTPIIRLFNKQSDFSYQTFSLTGISNIFVLSVLSNLLFFLSIYLLSLAVNIQESFVHISGIVSITGIINLLPITIMGMGTREASFMYFLSHYNNDQIFAFSMLMFLVAQVGGALLALLMSRIIWSKT